MSEKIEYKQFQGINFSDINKEKKKIPEPKTVERPPFKHAKIERLRKPIRILLEKLRSKIDNGEYDILIADDASGRLPGRIFYKFLKEVYQKNGFPTPQILFIPGGTPSGSSVEKHSSEIGQHLSKVLDSHTKHGGEEESSHSLSHDLGQMLKLRILGKPNTKHKIMVVTEAIMSGDSISAIVNAIQNKGIDFDIVTVGIDNYSHQRRKTLEAKFGKKIYYGMDDTPDIYRAKDLHGVKKTKGDKVSHKLAKSKEEQVVVSEAREDTDRLAGELADWYVYG